MLRVSPLLLTITLGCQNSPTVISVRPCMPIEAVVAVSTGLSIDDFVLRQQAYDDWRAAGAWGQLNILGNDGLPVLSLDDLKGDIYIYRGLVTMLGTDDMKHLPKTQLRAVVGALHDQLVARGLELQRQTPGDFLRTTSDNPVVRDAIYGRGDIGIRISIVVPPKSDTFGLGVAAWSNGACLPQKQLEDRARDEEELDRDMPRVKPPPP